MQTLHRRGVQIPNELALVTLNNSRLAALDEVPLTAVDVNNPAIAKTAVEMLLQHIKDPSTPTRHVLVDPFLVARESSTPYPSPALTTPN